MPVIRTDSRVDAKISASAGSNASTRAVEDKIVPPLTSWTARSAAFDAASGRLCAPPGDEPLLIESPAFEVPAGTTIHACLFFENEADGGLQLAFRSRSDIVATRSIGGRGELALGLTFTARRTTTLRLCLSGSGEAISVRSLKLSCRTGRSAVATTRESGPPTLMPHWNMRQRTLHRLCVRFRWLNAVVAAFELHAGREEVVSLPQYMAICPTGQCNASCQFCSVTTNRTGIIKKQLPFDSVDALISPVLGTLRLFGIEGNGEPTLYDHFDDLLLQVTAGGTPVYLITNAERLTPEQIGLLLASPVDRINVSLNAATGPTHREVMKLKRWDKVVANIDRMVRWRGTYPSPLISVSLVVTRQNAHEVQQFLRFCEWELRVDRILIRPLSEIANDSGVVEDLRNLVPYESQINDLLDSIGEYLDLVPRRAEIVIDPAAFRAFASDPPGRLQHPPGFEHFMLPPRREGWHGTSAATVLEWDGLSRLRLRSLPGCGIEDGHGPRVVARSVPVHVPADVRRVLRCRLRVHVGSASLRLIDSDGCVVDASPFTIASSSSGDDRIELVIPPGSQRTIVIEIMAGTGALRTSLDLGMTVTPAESPKTTLLPHPTRWQVDTPGTEIRWSGSTLSIAGQATAGRYLYRAYRVSPAVDQRIAFTVSVHLSSGALGMGVLSGDGTRWLATERFEDDGGQRSISFETVDSTGFQVVLYPLTDEPVAATADWGDLLDRPPRHNDRIFDLDELVLPVPCEWVCDKPGVQMAWSGSQLAIASQPIGKACVVHSPRFACPALTGVRAVVRFFAMVRSGRIGVGFLGASNEPFIAHRSFEAGEHEVSMTINAVGQSSLMAVVYSCSDEPLDATIHWRSRLTASTLDANTGWRGGTFDPRDGFTASSTEVGDAATPDTSSSNMASMPLTVAEADDYASLRSRISRAHGEGGLPRVLKKFSGVVVRSLLAAGGWLPAAVRARIRAALERRDRASPVYCQKPWTDLNNFTVDGRMDVCCIATGPSQERYALGNIFDQNFQEIWNGERMKEFRRTVNTPEKLPPCARCPMANNYSPPF
jgi:radical SAM protein with 4Fe4S-binding SPASM domain